MKLSIIIPVRDDETLLRDVVESVRAVPFRFLALEPEIVVVDDGSTDSTARQIASLGGSIDRVCHHDRPRGIGAAIRSGIELASGEIVAIQHCDLRYDPNELLALVRRLLDGSADAVYGRRVSADEPGAAVTGEPTLWSRMTALATRLSGATPVDDPRSGQKVFRSWCLDRIRLVEESWGIDVELPLKLQQLGWELQEMDVHFEDVDDHPGLVPAPADDVLGLRAAVRYGWFDRARAGDVRASRDAARSAPAWNSGAQMRVVPAELCVA